MKIPPIKTEHLQFPEYQQGMRESTYFECTFKKDDEGLYREILLPKNIYYNDFDASENLIELEDTGEGNRYWVETANLFKLPCPGNHYLNLTLNCRIDVAFHEDVNGGYFDPGHYQVNWIYTIQCVEFRPEIRRKRCYIQARFKKISEPKPFFRSKQTPN